MMSRFHHTGHSKNIFRNFLFASWCFPSVQNLIIWRPDGSLGLILGSLAMFWQVWTDFLYMMLCLILNILQRRANDPQLLSYFIIFSRFSVFYFQALDQHWILFWSQNSFLLMSAYLIGCFKIFSNDQVRWLASAKYARNEPSVGSKLRSLETSFAKTNQMSNRDDSKRWSDGLFLWTNNFEE